MRSHTTSTLRELSDAALLRDTKELVAQERETLAEILNHFSEIQHRKLFSPQHQSLFQYAVEELGYSEDEASRRISAMRLVTELPQIEADVRNGSLGLTTLCLARTYFRTIENQGASAPEALISPSEKLQTIADLRGKTKREAIQVLIAKSPTPVSLENFETIRPIADGMFELKILAAQETLTKIDRLKGILAHRAPYMTLGQAFETSLDLALTKLLAAKMNRSDPQVSTVFSLGRRPNSSLQKNVWQRAGGKCELCQSNFKLELDHTVPFALGGSTTIENLRLLCRNCNQREAIKVFGAEIRTTV